VMPKLLGDTFQLRVPIADLRVPFLETGSH